MNGVRLMIAASGLSVKADLENQFSSNDYGAKQPSVSVCWTVRAPLPAKAQFALIPVRRGENENERVAIVSEARA